MTEQERFRDLRRQGFMQHAKPRKPTKAEREAQAKFAAEQTAAFDASMARLLDGSLDA